MCVGNVPAALSEYSRHNVGSVFPGLAVVDGKLKILAGGKMYPSDYYWITNLIKPAK